MVTPGHKQPAQLERELDALALPDLRGKSVLDIGGWDGFFAFAAEQRGAARVAVIDHYMWAMDSPGQQAYWRRCMAEGVAPRPYHETEFWHPDELPGKRGFDVAHEALGSDVEAIVADFMTCDLDALGSWDVVLYLGVLYHMEEPLTAMRRVSAVTTELAVVETEAIVVPGSRARATVALLSGRRAQRRHLELVGTQLRRAAGAIRGGRLRLGACHGGRAGRAARGAGRPASLPPDRARDQVAAAGLRVRGYGRSGRGGRADLEARLGSRRRTSARARARARSRSPRAPGTVGPRTSSGTTALAPGASGAGRPVRAPSSSSAPSALRQRYPRRISGSASIPPGHSAVDVVADLDVEACAARR